MYVCTIYLHASLLFQDFGIRQDNKVWVCYGAASPNFFWQIFIFAYLAVLQIVGIVLAFQTRKVKLQGLRDSKFVATIIYISSVILVAIALVTFALRRYINVGGGIIAVGVFSLTTTILALIFIPKVRKTQQCRVSYLYRVWYILQNM